MTMDLTLIPSLIQDLLIKNECFILPETGRFTVVATPATFLEGGKGILPPGRKLVFEQGDFQGDFSPWQNELRGAVKESLAESGKFELPGFGVFTDEGEGRISFEVSAEFDFAPDSFSLEAIALDVMDPVVCNSAHSTAYCCPFRPFVQGVFGRGAEESALFQRGT